MSESGSGGYNFRAIEEKWRKKWIEEKVFRAKDDSPKPKYYQLETFPYPSAEGLHMGHPRGYTAEDIHARYMRMHGREVLYSIGWDAFGLPTENFAIKVGKSPGEVAKSNTDNFRRQVQMFGFSYDWDREISTALPDYYKWTQWIFIQLYKRGLAYRKNAKVNWCPKDQTVLANEQVVDGHCERCGTLIEEREMEQWFLKITDYADRLLDDLKGLDWPAATVKRQEDWIGKSEGAIIKFKIADETGSIASPSSSSSGTPSDAPAASQAAPSDISIEVFTTRPDTLFGATYLVLAPENKLIRLLREKIKNWTEVEEYLDAASHKTERMRQEEAREKTGIELMGIEAVNPATDEKIPVWMADYVLGSYGTGAIMAVPAHDDRDSEFAKKFDLPVKKVVDDGKLVNSGKFDGMDSAKAKVEVAKFAGGEMKTMYRLRDWSVSRQRYWGAPIPMVHCEKCGIVPVPEKDLPVLLPDLKDYRPQGMPPLAASEEFMEVSCPACGGKAKRDPETLDTFVDSSWYYLRYSDPRNEKEIFDKKKVEHWLPVDLYVIGAEHTVLHLLYSRFVTKFLHDEGYLKFIEPFKKIRHQGLILGEDGMKMSKSKGNVVNPDEIVAKYGADTVRMYEMFMGPFEDNIPWDPKSIAGIFRFLSRIYKFGLKIVHDSGKNPGSDKKIIRTLQKSVKKVGEDIEEMHFNTAISALMILLNESGEGGMARDDFEIFIKILHPFAPHLAQELWSELGHDTYLDHEPWPEYDPELIKDDEATLVVQVNGKVRATLKVPADTHESEATKIALADEKVKGVLDALSAKPVKIIYIDKNGRKLVSIVT